MFRKQLQRVAQTREPGHVEGPYKIDRVGLGTYGVDCLRLQDLMNARHHNGYELISHIHPAMGVSLLVWRKKDD